MKSPGQTVRLYVTGRIVSKAAVFPGAALLISSMLSAASLFDVDSSSWKLDGSIRLISQNTLLLNLKGVWLIQFRPAFGIL